MEVGTILGDPVFGERYELGEKLGQGGMGSVFRGVQRTLARPVAIKFLSVELTCDPEYLLRFHGEAKIAAEIIHQNVVVVFDSGAAGKRPYLVTELVEGESLATLLAREPIPPGILFGLARQVLDGLGAIHARGIVHRDLKPANILVTKGVPPCAKITDFGIAKQARPSVEGETEGPRTATGMVMGTPEFMAPEQIVGDPLSPATDLYAFSLILHRALTGVHPFEASSVLEMFHRQVHEKPVLSLDLAPAVRKMLERGLAKMPKDRFSSAAEYRETFDRIGREFESSAVFSGGGSMLADTALTPRPHVECSSEPVTAIGLELSSRLAGVSSSVPSGARPIGGALALLVAAMVGLFVLSRPSTVPGVVASPRVNGPIASVRTASFRRGGFPFFTLDEENVPPLELKVVGMKPDSDPSDRLLKNWEVATKVVTAEEDIWSVHLKLNSIPPRNYGWSDRFDHQPAGLNVDAPAATATFMPSWALERKGRVEIHYRADVPKGGFDVDLLSTTAHEPPVIYRLRIDLDRREWLCLVSDVEKVSQTKSTREHVVSRWASGDNIHFQIEWKPDPWKLVARDKFAALFPETTVTLAVEGPKLMIDLAGHSRTFDVPEPFSARSGPLWFRLLALQKTKAVVDRVVLTGRPLFDYD